MNDPKHPPQAPGEPQVAGEMHLREGRVLTGPYFSEPMLVETVRENLTRRERRREELERQGAVTFQWGRETRGRAGAAAP